MFLCLFHFDKSEVWIVSLTDLSHVLRRMPVSQSRHDKEGVVG